MSKKQTLDEFIVSKDNERHLNVERINPELLKIADVVRQKIALALSKTVDEIEIAQADFRIHIRGKVSSDYGQENSHNLGAEVQIRITPERHFFRERYKWYVWFDITKGKNDKMYFSDSGWNRNTERIQSIISNRIEKWIRENIETLRILSAK